MCLVVDDWTYFGFEIGGVPVLNEKGTRGYQAQSFANSKRVKHCLNVSHSMNLGSNKVTKRVNKNNQTIAKTLNIVLASRKRSSHTSYTIISDIPSPNDSSILSTSRSFSTEPSSVKLRASSLLGLLTDFVFMDTFTPRVILAFNSCTIHWFLTLILFAIEWMGKPPPNKTRLVGLPHKVANALSSVDD